MPQRDQGMTRGSFLKLFAAAPFVGAAVTGAAVTKAAYGATITPASTLDFLYFNFSGDSYRVNYMPPDQTGGPYPDRLVFAGSGRISGKFEVGQTVVSAKVKAQGSFAHYENNQMPGENIPLAFTGTWTATKLVSFQLLGLYGTDAAGNYPLAAGVLVLEIDLVRPATQLIPLTQVPSLLTLVSNLSIAGVPSSDLPDGVTLLAPNDPTSGFYFVPNPVVTRIPKPRIAPFEGTVEAHTPVLFSTLDEYRQNV